MKPLPGNTTSVERIERHLAGELPLPASLGIHLGMLIGGYPKPLLGMMGIGPKWQSGARAILTDISNVKGELTESPMNWLAKIMESEGVPGNRGKISGLFSGNNPPRAATCEVLAKHLPTFRSHLKERQLSKDVRAGRGKAAIRGALQLTGSPQVQDLAPICGSIQSKNFISNFADALQGAPGARAARTALAAAMREPDKMKWPLAVQISWLLGFTPDWVFPIRVEDRDRKLATMLIQALLDAESLPHGSDLYEWLKPRLQEQGITPTYHALGKWFKGLTRPKSATLSAFLKALNANEATFNAVLYTRGLPKNASPSRPRNRHPVKSLRQLDGRKDIVESISVPKADRKLSERIRLAAAEHLGSYTSDVPELAKAMQKRLASMAKFKVPLGLVEQWLAGTSGICDLEVDVIAASLSISTPKLISGRANFLEKVHRANDAKVIGHKLNAYTNTSLRIYPLMAAHEGKPEFEDRLKMLLYVRGVTQSPTASREEVSEALKYLMGFQYSLDRNSSEPIDPSEIRDLVLVESRCGSARGWLEDGILTRQSIVQFNLDRMR
ncbi:hypothetical protein AB9K35_07965 [Leisingera sp. XS_AS12]|uniref:hypothetical protein n=1 Tax=Leisingera sp. XS_AS12 TaxID=3241294 RepID=UPI00351196D0